MRTCIRFSATAVALLLSFTLGALAQVPGLMHYQGRVVVKSPSGNGTNFTGTGQFKFALVNGAGTVTYWSNNNSSVGASEPTAPVPIAVSNGLYSVLLGDTALVNMSAAIPPTVFSNPDVRLRVWFSDGNAAFELLEPDQRIAAVGYAMIAAGVPNGAITTAKLADDSVNAAKLSDNAVFANHIASSAVGAAELAGASVGAVHLQTGSVNEAKIVDGAITSAKLASTLALNTASVSGTLSFGATTRQMINLWSSATDTYAIGVQGGTLYQRSGSDFAWFKDGVHSNTAFDPGSGGVLSMRLDGDGELHVGGAAAGFSLQDRQTTSFIQTPASGERWVGYVNGGLYRIWSGNDKLTLDVNGKITASSVTLAGSSIAVNATATARGVDATVTSIAGVGVRGVSGMGAGAATKTGVYGESTYTDGNGVVGVAHNGSEAIGIWGKSISGWAGVFEGKVKVGVLTITGGADVAEPFRVSKKGIKKGSVVVIDEDNPGQLTESTEAYDKRVAGIISGANGVQPGLRLQQDGVLGDGEHVALSGRVYVRSTSANGRIKPGDLLTSSGRAGCAMRVTDHKRAQGAILGKAMTHAEGPEGYVLVLVTLQ